MTKKFVFGWLVLLASVFWADYKFKNNEVLHPFENSSVLAKADAKHNADAKAEKKLLSVPPEKPSYSAVLDENYIKNVIINIFTELQSQGLLTSEKAHKTEQHDPKQNQVSPSLGVSAPSPIIPTINLPATINDDGETFLTATQISTESFKTSEANIENLEIHSLTASSGAHLSEGGDWVNASSRDLKENFATISPATILEKIGSLPVYTWNYKSQTASVPHMGPLAEDFYSTFALGNSSTSISTIDPSGVALAGIQGLNEKLKNLLDFSWILGELKKLGIEITNGLIKAKAFIAESIRVEELEVGSSEKPNGITIYDRVSGEPICLFAESGTLKSENGKCGEKPEPEADKNQTPGSQATEKTQQEEAVSLKTLNSPEEPPLSDENSPSAELSEDLTNASNLH